MNRRIKEAAKGVVQRASKASKSLFQGSSSSTSRREALLGYVHPELQDVPIALQRSDDEDEEYEGGEGGEQEYEDGEEEDADDEDLMGREEEDKDDEDSMGREEEDEDDEESMGGDFANCSEFVWKQTRKSHVVTPPSVPTRVEDRVLIVPTGDGSWQDMGFDGRGHHRQVNAVLGNLCRLHNPGVVVNKSGQTIACTTWKDFALADDARFGNAQGAVRDAFWKHYRVDPEDKEHADRVFEVCAKKVCRDAFSNARLQATNAFMKQVLGLPVSNFREYSDTYLTEEEYLKVQLPWLEDRPDAYRALCRLWASAEFQAKLMKKRSSANKGGKHTFGGDGYIRTAKRMQAQTGVEPSPIDVYVRGHRGRDPAQPEVLCSQQASSRLEQYGQKMVRRHGENFDWRKGPIDPMAVHATGGGKSHGWYSMFTGVMDSRDVRSQKGSSSQTSGGSTRQYRRTEQDHLIENLQEALRAQNEYNLKQQEYNRQQQEYFANYAAQQQNWIALLLQQQGGQTNLPPPPQPPAPPPPPPPPMLLDFYHLGPPAAEGSGVNVANVYQTPPSVTAAPREDDRVSDFVNNAFASGGSGQNSNNPHFP